MHIPKIVRTCLAATLAAVALSVAAQPYPNKPIKLVVPFPPGGNVDLSAHAKARDGGMTMAPAGSGKHIVGELFQDAIGTRFVHVPYKGSAPAKITLESWPWASTATSM